MECAFVIGVECAWGWDHLWPRSVQFSLVQLLSRVWLFATPWIAARQASLSITNSRSFSDTIQPSHPLLSPSPPASNPSQHQSLFQGVNSSHEVAKVLEFQPQHHSSQRNPRVDLLQIELVGSPCSPRDSQESSPIPQFKTINSSTFSLLYGPIRTSIHDYGKVMSLLFNMLSWLVTDFLPRSKCLLISWLQSPSAVILDPKKLKSVTVSIVSPSICYEVMGPDAMIFIFWMLSFKPVFHSPLPISSSDPLVPLHFLS